MQTPRYRSLLHTLAVLTAATALLPIVVGALVTTLDAGMAFSDWPSSDGHPMLAYPWLKSAGDKFVEHGHRLAGIVIGCVSIVFAAAVWFLETRRWVRICGVGMLLAVVAQGLLGGQRVLADARQFAMLHGAFAAVVFAFMSAVALFLSRSWLTPPAFAANLQTCRAKHGMLKVFAAITPAAIVVQYLLGGLVRHMGTALFEHVGMAFVVLACVVATVAAARRTRQDWLKRPAYAMGLIALGQVLLGAATWATKFGLASFGYVAVERAPLQILARTSHTVVGMLLLMTSVVLLLRVLRIEWASRSPRHVAERPVRGLSTATFEGGL